MALSGTLRHDMRQVLAYPEWLLAAARARIEAAIEAADRVFKTAMARAVQVAPGPIMFTPAGAREEAATEALTTLLDTVVAILSAAAERIAAPAPDLEAAVESVSEQLIIRIYRNHPPTTIELEPFIARTLEQLHARPAWTALERTLTRLPSGKAVAAVRGTESRPLLTLKQAAKRLSTHPDTLKRMAETGELEIRRVGPKKSLRVSPAEIDRLLTHDKYRYRR